MALSTPLIDLAAIRFHFQRCFLSVCIDDLFRSVRKGSIIGVDSKYTLDQSSHLSKVRNAQLCCTAPYHGVFIVYLTGPVIYISTGLGCPDLPGTATASTAITFGVFSVYKYALCTACSISAYGCIMTASSHYSYSGICWRLRRKTTKSMACLRRKS